MALIRSKGGKMSCSAAVKMKKFPIMKIAIIKFKKELKMTKRPLAMKRSLFLRRLRTLTSESTIRN